MGVLQHDVEGGCEITFSITLHDEVMQHGDFHKFFSR